MPIGTSVEFPNWDNFDHNVFSRSKAAPAFDLDRYPKGMSKTRTFERLGCVQIFCNIHPQMRAVVYVTPNRYFARCDADGNFEITGLPPGEYSAAVWHERCEEQRQTVQVGTAPAAISFELKETRQRALSSSDAIRGGDLPGYTYAILLTSHDTTDEKVAGLAAGVDDFIAKPLKPAELLARVRTGERVLSLETRDVAIFAMAKLAESRDPETDAHLERVRSYCRIIAQHLATTDEFKNEVNAEYIRFIFQTSPLHDIGKVGIPDCVLLKPGRLSDREFEIMKTHAEIGAQTLEAALQHFPGIKFLVMARDIAAAHHERFDGTGYPKQIVGRDIPLCARIVALADVYDALTSKRTYKSAFAHDVAKGIILKDCGTHFDPAIVDAFCKTEPQFIAVRDRYCETRAAA